MLISTNALATERVESPTHIGNGGDIVYCKEDASNPFEGFHALDYIYTYQTENENSDVPVLNWEDSQQRIYTHLRRLAPEMANSFRVFVDQLFNKDILKSHIWEPKSFGLRDLIDESLVGVLPENCYNSGEPNRPRLIQAVIREKILGKTIYSYDARLFNRENSILPDPSFSFLAVHEWLWAYTLNARQNRRLNRILHSTTMETMPEKAFQLTLEKLGVALSTNDDESFRSIAFEQDNKFLKIVGFSPFWTGKTKGKIWIENRTNQTIEIYSPRSITIRPGQLRSFDVNKTETLKARNSQSETKLKLNWVESYMDSYGKLY